MRSQPVHRRAMVELAQALAPLGQDVASVLVYGSVARGAARTGTSDLIDAAVFLQAETLSSETRFAEALRAMAGVCGLLGGWGEPFQAFQYGFTDETSRVSAVARHAWHDAPTRLLWGRDLRREMRSRPFSEEAVRSSFYLVRRGVGHALAAFWAPCESHAVPDRELVDALVHFRKATTLAAAAALGIDLDPGVVTDELAAALPRLDCSVWRRIDALREASRRGRVKRRRICGVLRQALVFTEVLHAQLLVAGAGVRRPPRLPRGARKRDDDGRSSPLERLGPRPAARPERQRRR